MSFFRNILCLFFLTTQYSGPLYSKEGEVRTWSSFLHESGVEILLSREQSPVDFSNEEILNIGIRSTENMAKDCEVDSKFRKLSLQALSCYYFKDGNNIDLAYYWSRKGAQEGENLSMYVLGSIFLNGGPVIKSHEHASKWIILSYIYGYEPALGVLMDSHKELYKELEAIRPAMVTGLDLAKKWIKDHPELKQINSIKAFSFIK